ncbi:hypothetical protein R54767_05130 [Paraburkholderia gardini]|uniref:Uncharacterized protein n=1 Tax=Paraburkholderia gardini TaxID=2823469 RepID=A0ABM8UAW7_9BURK|nr:hypothetical protein R54767_05130 [Paraburkholderia gardini]
MLADVLRRSACRSDASGQCENYEVRVSHEFAYATLIFTTRLKQLQLICAIPSC